MRMLIILPLLLAYPLGTLGLDHEAPASGKAILFNNLGTHHCPSSTKSKEAQRFFDQGLTLCYAFNHAEAIRSFEAAARLDPDFALAYRAIALAYGPNINMPMSDAAVPRAYAALQKAVEVRQG